MPRPPESPPISPKTIRQKRQRQSSQDEPSVEEISPDDIGYDADAEVVHPDDIEEPESETEDERSSLGIKHLLWPDTEDELSSKMKRLSWHTTRPRAKSMAGANATDVTKLQGDAKVNRYGKRTEIEVSDMLDGHVSAPPPKRRKRKDPRLSRIISASGRWRTDTSDKTDEQVDSAMDSPDITAQSGTKLQIVDDTEMDLG